jgi:lytic murein transglycosylase
MQQAVLSRLSQGIETLLSFTMLRVLDNDQRIVKEHAFRLGLTDVMFIRILAAVAIVPVNTCDLVKVDHCVYAQYIQKEALMRYGFLFWRLKYALVAFVLVAKLMLSAAPALAADLGFTQFIASLWPEAQAAGVSRATFDAETRGLEPDYKLPDLILPGRPATGAPSQAEFVQVPADYLKEASITRLAAEGQRLMQKHRTDLAAIEARFGVPGTIVLAIWGRETDYGRYTLPYDGLRVLATQAYVGRRKDQYRTEFILALKLLGDGEVARKDLRTSWAGATGLTQFLPSELYKHGVDFDGDGRRDIWHSVPDALASAAQQLVNKGWQSGVRWAYEVRAPASVDCTLGVPEVTKPIAEWLREGFVPVRGQKLSTAEQSQPASLLQPEGIYGPAFLTTKNYFVIKEYNFSDLYVLFVGHLGDRMLSPQPFATPWSASSQLRTADVEAMQRHLTRIGLYNDKLDGKAGMKTRAALGAYQKSAGLKVDCWPSEAVLRSIGAAR